MCPAEVGWEWWEGEMLSKASYMNDNLKLLMSNIHDINLKLEYMLANI